MKIKTIAEQVEVLNKLFGLEFSSIIEEYHDPRGGEGDFAIPHWNLLGSDYNQAVERVLAKIKETRPFYNWREGRLGSKYLRQREDKARFWEAQKNQLTLLSCQLGSRYRGRSVMDVRQDFKDGEIGLGAYEVGIILLTHPDRLQRYSDLGIDCPGDEYSPDVVGVFSGSPCLFVRDDELRFGAGDVGYARGCFGSASWFFAQTKLDTGTLDTFESLNCPHCGKWLKINLL